MISDLNIVVSSELLEEAKNNIPLIDFKLSLNNPTGDFFYDQWKIKDEYANTVWGKILNTLPFDIGEARLIKLSKEKCYSAHADIDDRWHLTIIPGNSFLVDLEKKVLHSLESRSWYSMDAGVVHSAVNFGGDDRIQLVVRKLLTRGNLQNPVHTKIKFDITIPNWRYVFDHVYSPILNRLNKNGLLDSFKIEEDCVSFDIEYGALIPTHEYFEVIV